MKEPGLNVILLGAEIVKCKKCGNEDPILRRMDDLMRSVALAVVQKPYRLTGQEVRSVRKYLHLTGREFAKTQGGQLDAVEVGAWRGSGRSAERSANPFFRNDDGRGPA
jgi:hypothetical protein